MLTQILRKLRSVVRPAPSPPDTSASDEAHAVRRRVASRHLVGNGIEVGALHCPLWVPDAVKVRYVDRMPVADLKRHYPELADLPLVNVDVVDDGETLKTFTESSQDFIVSNHFLEHTQDPIGTLKRHVSLLRPGGILYLAVPDKRWTFDIKRPETTIEHLLRDHGEGPEVSYDEHVREYAELVDGLEGEALEERIRFLKRINYSIHFHVWTETSFRALLAHAAGPLAIPVTLLEMISNPGRAENIAVLRRD